MATVSAAASSLHLAMASFSAASSLHLVMAPVSAAAASTHLTIATVPAAASFTHMAMATVFAAAAASSIQLGLPLTTSLSSSASSSSFSASFHSSCRSLGVSCRRPPMIITHSLDELCGLSSHCLAVRFKGDDDAAQGWRIGFVRGRHAAARGATRASIGGIRIALPFITGKGDRQKLKQELLEAIMGVDRGAEASPEDELQIDKIARKLEALNPTKEPLKSPLLNGKWQLLYTTSRSILKKDNPKFLRPWGPIYQSINTDTLRAQNMETWPFFNQVTANLVPLSTRKVAVKFDTFKIGGLISVKAPGRARGELEITYLEEQLRISRGDRGNLFVLEMVDPAYRVPM